MLHPTVFNTAHICHLLGVEHAVMSPGSRNAPLTISFARHEKIKKWIFPDERAAGFVALGIAQHSKSPVVLCCTSGTALLNYAPAIAEAYYREIPLVILSADRPPELIDQRDGQTIRQFEALKNHVKASIQLPLIKTDKEAEEYSQKLINGLLKSEALPKGPVHINIPFAEPFYPTSSDSLTYEDIPVGSPETSSKIESEHSDLSKFSKVLILMGQSPKDDSLSKELTKISERIPVLRFPLNNIECGIEHSDLFISKQEELRPELLITSGLSVLSKKMKLFLRSLQPKKHIHFDPSGVKVDTFQSNPELVKNSLSTFITNYNFESVDDNYLHKWREFEDRSKRAIAEFEGKNSFSETVAAKEILQSIPSHSNLHLSNSMPVRYADMFGVNNSIECFSNRGTSGIDGCTSTALGTSLISDKLNVLITGDLAFLYDRNAFFHNYQTPNLRIVILNNQGGGIFRLIDGPANLPELEEYFETRHNRTAKYICDENGLEYITADRLQDLNNKLPRFFEKSNKAKVLEVFTDPEINQRVYKELKKHIDERIKN